MTRAELRKLTSRDLVKQYERILTAKAFTPEDAVALSLVVDEMHLRKDLVLQPLPNELVKRADYASGEKTAGSPFTTAQAPEAFTEVNLTVLDKEAVPGLVGLQKYSFGYALDSTKPFEGENMVKAFEVMLYEAAFKVDSVVCVKVEQVRPFVNGKVLFEAEMKNPFAYEVRKEKPHSSKEIIRKAYKAGVLDLDQSTAQELNRLGILKVNIDQAFGVSLDKQFKITKASAFGSHGVVYGVVYPVDEVDTDGDSATAEEVMKACWKFMSRYRKLNYMHAEDLEDGDVEIVECATALANAPELGIKKGDWYMAVKVNNPTLREQIEKGEITGFSMEGTALPGGN